MGRTVLKERICYECGKRFIPAPYHKYRDEQKWFCKWTCYNIYKIRKEEQKKRQIQKEQKDKL